MNGTMTAFLRGASGAIYAGGKNEGYKADSAHASFQTWPSGSAFSWPQGLAERDGALFIAGDNFADGFALAVSRDDGKSVEPLFRYDQLHEVSDCPEAQAMCVPQLCPIRMYFGAEQSCPLPPALDGSVFLDSGAGAGSSKDGCGCSLGERTGADRDHSRGCAVICVMLLLGLRRRLARRHGAHGGTIHQRLRRSA